uniref:TIMELESS-interacting protein n=1 Tax=Gasterosteus aculeatus aculeatus TaxID=481459 RepID=A0AAQ4RBY2_GASAC
MAKSLSDLRDYDSIEDETFAPLPPPHSPGHGGQEAAEPFDDGEDDADGSKLADVPASKRRGVKRPQPKLDSQRLTSERGLPALRTLFDNVRFKGKGHEVRAGESLSADRNLSRNIEPTRLVAFVCARFLQAEDLRLLMQKMENWAHRLYPKLQFEDFVDKVEKLGNKKEVQTCLKRIRLDMPLTHEDFMGGEAAVDPEAQLLADPDPFNSSSFTNLPPPVHSTPAPPPPQAPPSMTEEQRERMEQNRRRALERRLTRQQQQPCDSSADEAKSVSSARVNSPEDRAEGVEPEGVESASSTQQQEAEEEEEEEPSQLPHTDSEPPAGPPRSEREQEPVLSEDREDGD